MSYRLRKWLGKHRRDGIEPTGGDPLCRGREICADVRGGRGDARQARRPPTWRRPQASRRASIRL